MKIDLLCNDGSPIGVIPPLIEGRGVGGAELAMMTLMEQLAKRDHEVTVYNNPVQIGEYEGVRYVPISTFHTEHKRDALIIFRSPNARVNHARISSEQVTVWWSTDQYTVGDFSQLGALVDFVVTISPFHSNYHNARYGIAHEKMHYIDLPVRTWEYEQDVEKDPFQCIFCSVPDRGLDVLLQAWKIIKERIPEAKLVITSDYTLWGAPHPGNQKHRLQWAGQEGVEFVGKVERHKMVIHQLRSTIHAYPCTYEELFCISAAECQVAGALPITSAMGALPTTNEFGVIIPGHPRDPGWMKIFTGRIIDLFTEERNTLHTLTTVARENAKNRFGAERIISQWEHVLSKGTMKGWKDERNAPASE